MKLNEVLVKAYEMLKSEGIESYMLDAQILLCKVLNKDKLFIMLNREVELLESEIDLYFELISLRMEKMPIKYILKKCEFMGMEFNIEPGVLIPRPDTEVLVEKVIERVKENQYIDICDVCCGSGAIGLSIAAFVEKCNVKLLDISDTAIKVSKENTVKFDLSYRAEVEYSDLLSKPIEEEKQFDCIVSNPPYIREEVIPTLMKDVVDYEPRLALDGGEDGLMFYREITKQSKKCLKSDGMLAYEIGHDQSVDVENILKNNGFERIETYKDLAGHDRVVIGFKS